MHVTKTNKGLTNGTEHCIEDRFQSWWRRAWLCDHISTPCHESVVECQTTYSCKAKRPIICICEPSLLQLNQIYCSVNLTEFERYLCYCNGFEFVKYLQCSGDSEFERYLQCSGLGSPVVTQKNRDLTFIEVTVDVLDHFMVTKLLTEVSQGHAYSLIFTAHLRQSSWNKQNFSVTKGKMKAASNTDTQSGIWQ